MGRLKYEMMEVEEQERARLKELDEMNLEKQLEEISKDIEEKNGEIKFELDYEEDEEKEDLQSKLSNISNLMDEIGELEERSCEIEDLIHERNELRESMKPKHQPSCNEEDDCYFPED